jgi:hypothetical protein
MLPQPFYDWYKPYRDQFAVQAKQLMALELQTLPTIKDNGKQENGLAKLTVPQ